MPTVTRELLASTLDEIALLLELRGENPFKIRAYRTGSEVVREFDGDIVQLARDNELKGIKGLGDALQEKLHELASTGTLKFHQDLKATYPAGLFELFELPGLGPKKIKALYDQLSIGSVNELKSACEDGRVASLSGFGAKTATKILEEIKRQQQHSARFRLGDVVGRVEMILESLRSHPDAVRVAVAGSYRRAKETVGDLDFLVATRKPATLTQFFTTLAPVDSIIACGDTKASVRLDNGLQCDLRAVANDEFPFALLYFSGSKEHNVAIRSRALKQGLSLNEYAFQPHGANAPTKLPVVHEEADIYRALKLDYIPPEIRENRGEIEAAEAGEIPKLIELENLRGTFHNHTRASDGKSTLEEMAEAAQDHGLAWFGISDHSKSSFQANGLTEDRLLHQMEEIANLNKSFKGFRLFAGSEVDILKDGSLDFDDELLRKLDFVVASVHNAFALDEEEMTKRVIRAMENPHVTMLGHMTGRLLLRRDGYAINHQKIIDCAAETRTVIELNCNLKRLDMDWRWWRRARDQGVLCSINPDAHSAEQIGFLALGVRVARKGWLRRNDVLNTRSLPEIEEFLRTPKHQREQAS